MKFFKNLFVLTFSFLFIGILLVAVASASTGNAQYVFLVALILLAVLFIILNQLNLWTSIVKDAKATPEELVDRSIKMQKFYLPEIIFSLAAAMSFYFGIFYDKDVSFSGLIISPLVFTLLGIVFLILIVVSVFRKKTVIKNLSSGDSTDKRKIKIYQKVVIFAAITSYLAQIIYNRNDSSSNFGVFLALAVLVLSLLYFIYLSKKTT